MKHEYSVQSLNIVQFAKQEGQLQATVPLADMPRLLRETLPTDQSVAVYIQARGWMQADASGAQEPWLHLQSTATLRQTCQRCLQPVDMAMQVDRQFRFVATEELAEIEDEESEEDVLVISQTFSVQELAEDEFLMDMPAIPMHAVCPQPVRMAVQDKDFDQGESEKPNPFAVLQQFKKGGS
ncbi:DUF177 domain-containing protein [Curvibacter sp. CHRR-16]|uniref:YceD family protein n=1 Tax=Curvibacter sp. CHRR-16 TaxID=2835872 RepID=UPI001BD9FCA4|nr:DUF177 domain-containing protein [Curvibacter sp. CHRR-16]MBT0571370.1 DUF177 domain-containing protein [Curvibacter sp. CHRR-16]